MLLSFKTKLKNKQTFFEQKIKKSFIVYTLRGHEVFLNDNKVITQKFSKPHTIREDTADRWHEGKIIHFCTGARTQYYNHFATATCTGTQKIKIVYNSTATSVFIDEKQLTDTEVNDLAHYDGFISQTDFFDFFLKSIRKKMNNRQLLIGEFNGKIIHWTTKRY